MVKIEAMRPSEVAILRTCLPELMVMARARHALDICRDNIDISFCGHAANWEECCTVTDMGHYTQAMLWYNVGHDTHGVALEINVRP